MEQWVTHSIDALWIIKIFNYRPAKKRGQIETENRQRNQPR